MTFLRSATVSLVVVVAVACAAPGGSGPTGTSSAATSPVSAPTDTGAANRINVTLSDAMHIEPAQMTVRAGVPVTYVVTNAGSIDHEFTLGDEEIQAEHEQEMLDMPGMHHDEDNSVSVEPGQTEELVFSFEQPGTSLAGCHVPGHYPAGMKAIITITG